MSDLISPKDVGKMLGVTNRWATELIRRGDIKGQKVGDRWVTTRKDVEKYMKTNKIIGPGSPPKEL